MAEPPAKKAKTDEGQEVADKPTEDSDMVVVAEVREKEPPKELETDAPASQLPKIKDEVVFHVPDTTLNVLPSAAGNLLLSLSDGGFQYLLAGARASVGIRAGRYMFETKIVEFVNPSEDHGCRNRTPMPKNLLKVGFSTSRSTLFLGEGKDNICFDSEGSMVYDKQRTPVGQAFARDSVVAIVLNLEDKSPNFNTISLFKDGVRVSAPQELPETLRGKTLFPTVTFKNMTVCANFGPHPLVKLPFTCRMIQDASIKDSEVKKCELPKDGKYEVVLPIGIPDENTFDRLDMWLEEHPNHTELSDRSILDWAEKSGVWRPKGYAVRNSNDKPDMAFGIPSMDDQSVRRAILALAPVQRRDLVVMEVKGNLCKEDRAEMLERFNLPHFKRVAQVAMGEPSTAMQRRCQELILKQKQDLLNSEFKARKAEEDRKRKLARRHKELEKAKKKAAKDKQKAAEAARKSLEAKAVVEKKEDEGTGNLESKDGTDEKKEEVKETDKGNNEEKSKEADDEEKAKEKGEAVADTKPMDEDEEDEEEEDPEDKEEPPKAELTPDEKKMLFRKLQISDLTPYTMNTSFMKFSLPEAKEGFDEVKYEWSALPKCEEYLKQWIQEKKNTSRIEDLQPSEWFSSKWADWQKQVQQWHNKQNEFKAAAAKKAAAEKHKEAAAKAGKTEENGEEKDAKPKDEEKADEPMEEAPEEKTVNFDDLDIFGIDDVNNIGDGSPLFKEFQFEDWTMMSLRFELHLLAHAFRHDADDPERTGIHMDHLAFYYNKYYRKALSPKFYGMEAFKDLVEIVKDVLYVTKKSVIESQLPDTMECLGVFIKLTEEARRHRNLRIDMGEDSARLKLSQPATYHNVQQRAAPRGNAGVKGGAGSVRPHWQYGAQHGKGAAPYVPGYRPPTQGKPYHSQPWRGYRR